MFSSSFYSFCILFLTLHTNYDYSFDIYSTTIVYKNFFFNFQLTNIAVYIISNHISNYNYWTLMDGIARFYVDLSYFFFTVESYNPDTVNHGKKQHCQHVQFISYVNNNRQCLFLQQFLTNCCKNSRESYSYNK